jgi:NADH-quinone oxidoreductase subunit F
MIDFATLVEQAKAKYCAQNNIKPAIMIGTATCGKSAGAIEVLSALKTAVDDLGIDCELSEAGCVGVCYAEPVVYITKPHKPGIIYGNVTAAIARELIEKYLLHDEALSQYAFGTVGTGTYENIPELYKTPIFKHQVRRVSKRCGFIDPSNIYHYIATDGYAGLKKAFALKSNDIIDVIKASGLRGRGGGGFPTWRKWLSCFEASGDQKYLICNADEGDPGASMNRMLLESDPHAIIEGMTIAAYTIGASLGYIYCRAEYPLAIKRLNLAISEAEKLGFFGDNILGSGFNFHLKVKEGAGAFVCGEETALIASIEGKRGMPRPRPPYPAMSGLWGRPTVINNVETFAAVSHILQNGAAWFAECGTEKSTGTKIFSLVGKIKYPCMAEVPLGTTLRTMIYDIGGGVSGAKQLKAVQTGGPSGGSIPVTLLDTPIDYDSLSQAGTIMGSGGMVVMDEDDCMVDIARYFLDFTQKESCGECVPCRLGTKQMLDVLQKLVAGKGEPKDIQILSALAETIKKTALCGLGQTAPNPVLTTLRYFKDEYEAHIYDKRCPAKVCKALMHYGINAEKCIGCDLCAKACPVGAISGAMKAVHIIDQAKCIKCGVCFETCPPKVKAVEKKS